MKATPSDQERLLDLQGLDTRLAQLARRESTLPETQALAEAKADRDRVRADLLSLRGAREDDELELRRVEADVDVVVQRLAQDEQRMLQATDAKQATAFEHEIATLTRRRGDLEEVQLIVMQRLEDHATALAAVEADLRGIDERVEAAGHALEAALEQIRAEREEVTQQRAIIARALPAELLALYEKQRERYGYGASLLRRGVSEASGVALLADELAAVRAAAPDEVLLCSSSNAILVRTSESGL